MSTTHTPGPWTVSRRNNVHFQPPCVLARGGNMTIADGLGDGPEAEANARLIASAPELLAALEALLSADEAICENRGTKSDQAMNRIAAIDSARALIRKAKGRE